MATKTIKYTVKKGDCLWNIAKTYLGSGTRWQEIAKLNGISTTNPVMKPGQTLTIKKGSSSTTTSKTKKASKSSNSTAAVKYFGLQSGTEDTLFAAWTWDKHSKTEEYKVMWTYYTGDGVGFVGSDSSSKYAQSTYTIPSNAKKVTLQVKPISKTYKKKVTTKVNGKTKTTEKEMKYFTAGWSKVKTFTPNRKEAPNKPPTPTVTITNGTLKATVTNIDTTNSLTNIEFRIIRDNKKTVYAKSVKVAYAKASLTYTCALDHKYKVRCRAYSSKTKLRSEWSEYSEEIGTRPAWPKKFTLNVKAKTDTQVYLSWTKISSATGYVVQYTTNKYYFDKGSADGLKEVTISTNTPNCYIDSLEAGVNYFRVKAKNDNGETGWCKAVKVTMGTTPSPPTTWSSSTTAVIGEPLILYWVHNSEDESEQTAAKISINNVISSITSNTKSITVNGKSAKVEFNKTGTSSVTIDTSSYSSDTNITWKVSTKGAANKYSAYSIERKSDIYSKPNLSISLTDKDDNAISIVKSFPIRVRLDADPDSQNAISYHTTIISNDSYSTNDALGNVQNINIGDSVYSAYHDANSTDPNSLILNLSAEHVDLENNHSYTITSIVSMNTGLTAESDPVEFTVSWDEKEYNVQADINIDPDTLSASIRPYCEKNALSYYKVTTLEGTDGTVYTKTDEVISLIDIEKNYVLVSYSENEGTYTYSDTETSLSIDATSIRIIQNEFTEPDMYDDTYQVYSGTRTDTSESVYFCIMKNFKVPYEYTEPDANENTYQVCKGTDSNGTEIFYCEVEEYVSDDEVKTELVTEGITMAVYRREFDGTFTEIETGIENPGSVTVIDPHPALDYARYRIVAIDNETGSISYYDTPSVPVDEKSVVIQWEEQYSTFNATDNDEGTEEPVMSTSMLKLPFNIDVSNSHSQDVELVEYIGRKHPVSYYGTQLGETATWNVVIEKSDIDTLYAIRRLAIWMGDVYVREPSGSGYWASITVSFNQNHCELTIPVSISITRVEGGK